MPRGSSGTTTRLRWCTSPTCTGSWGILWSWTGFKCARSGSSRGAELMGILGFIARRLLLAVPVFVGVTLVTFVLMQLVRGDLGISYRTDRSVLASILERVPATAALAVAALGLAILIGVATGIIAALRQNTMFDSASIIFATIGVSIPNFWLGLLLIYLLAVHWRWLPPSGYGPAYPYLIMPAITLGTALSAVIARLTRSSMLDVIRADYIRTARVKGLADRRVLLAHALRNAAIPIITVIGVQLSGLLSGTVITERVFSWPGIGRLLVDSIAVRDLPMVQGCVLFIATVFIGLNLCVDLSYVVLDPRIKYE